MRKANRSSVTNSNVIGQGDHITPHSIVVKLFEDTFKKDELYNESSIDRIRSFIYSIAQFIKDGDRKELIAGFSECEKEYGNIDAAVTSNEKGRHHCINSIFNHGNLYKIVEKGFNAITNISYNSGVKEKDEGSKIRSAMNMSDDTTGIILSFDFDNYNFESDEGEKFQMDQVGKNEEFEFYAARHIFIMQAAFPELSEKINEKFIKDFVAINLNNLKQIQEEGLPERCEGVINQHFKNINKKIVEFHNKLSFEKVGEEIEFKDESYNRPESQEEVSLSLKRRLGEGSDKLWTDTITSFKQEVDSSKILKKQKTEGLWAERMSSSSKSADLNSHR